jgi:arginase family enzyme
VDSLQDLLRNRVQLAGMDVTEINPRRAGDNHATGEDRTYRIAANIIKKFLGGVDKERKVS